VFDFNSKPTCLKVCCELASQLGSLLSKLLEKDERIVERCGQIIISVLQKCRHKGAFEAAGVALSGFVRDISASGEYNLIISFTP
jgi:hypothetical protein